MRVEILNSMNRLANDMRDGFADISRSLRVGTKRMLDNPDESGNSRKKRKTKDVTVDDSDDEDLLGGIGESEKEHHGSESMDTFPATPEPENKQDGSEGGEVEIEEVKETKRKRRKRPARKKREVDGRFCVS